MSISEAAMGRHLDHLVLGPRYIGSPANNSSASYLAEELKEMGFEVEEQRYPCPAWECEAACLEIGGRAAALTVNAFSPSCEVTSCIIPVGTIQELERAKLERGIVLLYGDLAQRPISAKSWFLKTERDARIIELLENATPAALLAVDYGTPELGQLLQDWEVDIPSATVSWDTGLRLVRGSGEAVRLSIDTHRAQGSTANIVGRRPGARPERIVLCAHYDTAINTPGACDNAGGVAALLALTDRLVERKLKYGLEIVFFTGEEYLPMGDDEYLRRAGDGFSRIAAAVNIDGAGVVLGSNSITAISCSRVFERMAREIAGRYPGVAWVDPWPQSNHSTFSWRGVPSLALGSVGERRIAHRPEDGVQCVSIAKLVEAVSMVEEIVTGIQDKSPTWLGRKKTPKAPMSSIRKA